MDIRKARNAEKAEQTIAMPPPTPQVQQERQREYAQIAGEFGSQADLAEALGVRRECVTRRVSGSEPISREALLAARYVQELARREEEGDRTNP